MFSKEKPFNIYKKEDWQVKKTHDGTLCKKSGKV